MRLSTKFGAGALIAVLAIGLGLASWYWRDRPQMLEVLCEAGLPNFSRPPSVSKETLGCVILARKGRYRGVVETAFEYSVLISAELPPTGGVRPGRAWFTCNQVTGCDPRLDAQLDQPIPRACLVGLASVTVDGWVTETPGGYGHLNASERQFYTDRVISVDPPPPDSVEEHQRIWTEIGGGECPESLW